MKIQTWHKEWKGQVAALNNKTVSPLFTEITTLLENLKCQITAIKDQTWLAITTNATTAQKSPLNGKDDWKVWFNRFQTIANRQGWSDEDKLDHLLLKLQGSDGDFVFTQLPRETLENYCELIGEINNRFRVIETPRTFAAKETRDKMKQQKIMQRTSNACMIWPTKEEMERQEEKV